MDGMEMSPRIRALKEKMLAQPRYVSIEQAQITTRVYRENENEPANIRRALALRAAMREISIAAEPEELIVGNRTAGVRYGVVSPESGSSWLDRELETLPTRPQDRFEVRPEDIRAFREEIAPYWKGRSLEDVLHARIGGELAAIKKVVKINQTDHSQGHICPSSGDWLKLGPAGLLRQARERGAAANSERAREFYEGVTLVMQGACEFMLRYRELLEELAAKPENAAHREDLLETAAVCGALAQRPARTFHEAVQAEWFLFTLLHLESNASSFSFGRLDRILWPYYKADTESGRLTRGRALELVECLWLKCNQIVYLRNRESAKYFAGFPIGFNIALGGQDEAGNDFGNALSHLFLDAQAQLLLPQPNLSVRLHKGTGEELLEHAVRVVAKGSGMPQFFNDECVVPSLEHLGVSHADALDYGIVGCVELTAQGNSLGWSDAAMFNLNKALELTLNHGRCLLTGQQLGPDLGGLETYADYGELEAAFAKQIGHFVGRMVRACEEVERAHSELLPTPFLSAVIDDCMEKGEDVTAGGAHYNFSGIQMIQVANLADSLAAVKKLVYDERRIRPEELMDALRDDFAHSEVLRQTLLNKAPKYGNDTPWVDEIGEKWGRFFRRQLAGFTNFRGGPYHTGMYTVSAHVPMGENVGASPDGRHALAPLADGGLSPVYGRDRQGPTAVLRSVSCIENDLTSNGGLLNMKFLPEFFATEQGVRKFCQFLRAFVDLEVPHIQFNVVRREDLLAAQKDPERYRSLTVRVAGYTAYFTELAGKLQDEIIARTSYDSI